MSNNTNENLFQGLVISLAAAAMQANEPDENGQRGRCRRELQIVA